MGSSRGLLLNFMLFLSATLNYVLLKFKCRQRLFFCKLYSFHSVSMCPLEARRVSVPGLQLSGFGGSILTFCIPILMGSIMQVLFVRVNNFKKTIWQLDVALYALSPQQKVAKSTLDAGGNFNRAIFGAWSLCVKFCNAIFMCGW